MWGALMISGFTAGLAGSLHCAGMCGPLSLALPVHTLSPARKWLSISLYQTGRLITYCTLGLLVALAGRMIYTGGFQRWFSISAGALILILAAGYFLQRELIRFGWLSHFYKGLQNVIGKILRSKSGPAGFLFMGMANGLLPCGMVYIALLVSVSFAEHFQSVAFMAFFGLGTFPMMMMIALAGHLLKPSVRSVMRQAFPVMVTLMGILLILRGLNLGIPFLSPGLPEAPGQAVVCH